MARQRLSDWIGNSDRKASPKGGGYSAGFSDIGQLLVNMRRGAPGQWSQNVTELARHFTGTAFVAINTIATQASGSTFKCYERTDDPDVPDGKIQLPWHDPIHQFFEDPNAQDTFADHVYQCSQQLALTGMSLNWAVPGKDRDEPVEQYSLPTATAWPMPPAPQFPFGAYRVLPYPYGLTGAPVGQIAAGAIIPAEQVVRVRNPHPLLRYDGYAVLTAISLQIDTVEAMDKSRHSTQQLGCDQTTMLEFDEGIGMPSEDDIKRIRAQLEALYQGPANTGKLFVGLPGTTLKKLSTSPKDMDWVNGWSQIVDFCFAAFNVPKAVAGMQENLSYSTLYASLRAFSILSLGPMLGRFGGGWTKHIVRPAWGKQYGIDIYPREFKDEQLFESQLSNDAKGGMRLGKEWRRARGLDELDPKKHPWVNDRVWAQGQPNNQPEGGSKPDVETGATEGDPNVDRARPVTTGKGRDALMNAFEKAKTNGHALPIKE